MVIHFVIHFPINFTYFLIIHIIYNIKSFLLIKSPQIKQKQSLSAPSGGKLKSRTLNYFILSNPLFSKGFSLQKFK